MNAPDRDRTLDPLLRRPGIHATRGHGDDCLDVETLAAWMDGGLDRSAAASAELHMSTCARCQALVATMARAESTELRQGTSGDSAPVPWWRLNLRWLAPLAAGATAAVLWTVVPDRQGPVSIAERQAPAAAGSRPEASIEQRAEVPKAEGFAAPLPQAAPERERLGASPEAKRTEKAEAGAPPSPPTETIVVAGQPPVAETSSAAVAEARPPDPPPSAAAAPAAPPAPDAGRRADAALFKAPVFLDVPTPNPAIRWRVSTSAIERTTDGGSTWTVGAIAPRTVVLAGSAPSTEVCWLAGRSGAVLLTTDGGTWRRVAAPSTADIVAVSATDDLNAVVRTADGQAFRTEDGGATWSANPY